MKSHNAKNAEIVFAKRVNPLMQQFGVATPMISQRVWLEEVKRMFAVVQTGGKQYNVTENDVLKVEKLPNAVGDKIKLDVLLVSDGNKTVAGNPLVKTAEVVAEVLGSGKGDKIVVFKYKPKKNERTKQGHRQPWTEIKIVSIKM